MIKNISIRKLRGNLAKVMKDVNINFDRYIVSKRGQPEAIIMSIEDYEGWLETIEIMSSPEAMEEIKKAKKELKEGNFYTFEEVFSKK